MFEKAGDVILGRGREGCVFRFEIFGELGEVSFVGLAGERPQAFFDAKIEEIFAKEAGIGRSYMLHYRFDRVGGGHASYPGSINEPSSLSRPAAIRDASAVSTRVEEVVDEVVAEFEVEAAGVLRRVLGVGVVSDYVGGAACGIEVEVAAKAVLPSGVTDQF